MILYQSCSNHSALLNKMAAKAKKSKKKKLKQLLFVNQWMDFDIVHRNVPWETLYEYCSNSFAPKSDNLNILGSHDTQVSIVLCKQCIIDLKFKILINKFFR